jgi:hypothetical protein
VNRTRLALASVLCSVVVLGVAACEDISATSTATTVGPEVSTTVAEDLTTTLPGETTTVLGPETTTADLATGTTAGTGANPGSAPTTTTTLPQATGTTTGPTPVTKLLKGTYEWDVDANVDGAGAANDLWYEIVDELVHYLQPENGAQLARLVGKKFDAVGLSDLQAAAYSSNGLATQGVDDPNVLMPGDVIALFTNGGHYVKMEVAGFEPYTDSNGWNYPRYNIRFRYVLYPS